MQKNVYGYMSEEWNLEEFELACEELLASKYILADGCIAAVLRAVAGNRHLYCFFEQMAGASYSFTDKLNEYTVEEDGEELLKYPKDYREFLSFVLGLLYMFDVRKLELHNFLNKYYADSDGISASYKRFLHEAVQPFQSLAVEQLEAMRINPL